MSYIPPASPNIVFDFSTEPTYTPPLSGAIEFSWGNILTSFIWLQASRKYRIQATWGEIANAAYYSISILQNGSSVDGSASLQALSFESKALQYDTEYQIVVEGKANDGTVIETKEATERTPVPVPNKPGSLTSTIEATSVSLAWANVNYATAYLVKLYKDGVLIESKSVNNSACDFTGLENATDYVVYISAENVQGDSEAKEYLFKTLYFLPDPVTNIRQETEHTLTVPVKWDLPTNTAVLQVGLEARDTDGTVFYTRTFGSARVKEDVRVEIQTKAIEVRVRAGNPTGWSIWSAWIPMTSEVLVEPDSVLGLLAGAQQPDIQRVINWTGIDIESKGINEEIGINASLLMFYFTEEETSQLSYGRDIGSLGSESNYLPMTVSNFNIEARNLTNEILKTENNADSTEVINNILFNIEARNLTKGANNVDSNTIVNNLSFNINSEFLQEQISENDLNTVISEMTFNITSEVI